MIEQEEGKPEPTLYDEFALLAQDIPDFADRLIVAIEQGKILGSAYVWHNRCGCAYGNIIGLSHTNEIKIQTYAANMSWRLYGNRNKRTPMENLVLKVRENETHETNSCLAILYVALQPYRTQRVHNAYTTKERK